MKKGLLLFAVTAACFSFGQQSQRSTTPRIAEAPSGSKVAFNENQPKTLLCRDTLRYPLLKEQQLGAPAAFYRWQLWRSDNEAISQTYIGGTTSVSISGIEFYGSVTNATGYAGPSTVTVRASIYSVNGTFTPQAQLATGTVSITGTTGGYRYVNFGTAVNVTGNYAVVIEPTTTSGIIDIWVNDIAAGQQRDENLSRWKSTYYTCSAGAFVGFGACTGADPVGFGGNYHMEPLVAPIVSYTINTTTTANPNVVCQGTPVNFTTTATPNDLLTNRMHNYQAYRRHFNFTTNDSTYAWNMGNASPIIWQQNPTYTYPAPSTPTYTATGYTLGGFWASCLDNQTKTITVNARPTVGASATNPTICQGSSTILNPTGATSYTWNQGIGAVTSPTVTPGTTTTYTVTGTNANNCTNTATVTVTVNQLDNATFAYASNTLCTSGGNVTPSVSTPGTFSTSPGLVFVSSTTGEIDMASSTDGNYTVTYTTSGSCPNSSNQIINITGAPDATFSYPNVAYCTGTSNPLPSFGAGASAGTFSSTGGLIFVNANTGEINLATSTPGSYTVTNTIPMSGSCPSDVQTYNITINQAPAAVVSGGGTMCGDGSTPIAVTITLNGVAPWDFTYSDGTNSNTITNHSSSTYTINANANGNFSVFSVISNGCTVAGTGNANVTFNPNPTVSITPVNDVCNNASLVSLSATPAGGTFSGSGIVGSTFNPATTAGNYTVNYNYTDANSCSGSSSIVIVVKDAPNVTLAAIADVCLQNGAFTLTGASPANGVFSGTGVSGTTFTPTAAGTATVTYTFQDANGCSDAASQSFTVNNCAGIEELNNMQITVYPNPSNSGVLNISVDQETTCSLFSQEGKLVIKDFIVSGNYALSTNELAKGVYYLNARMDHELQTIRVVIQ